MRLLMIFLLVSCGWAEASDDFVNAVRPILRERCYGCHGPDERSSGLRLDNNTAAFAGGDLYGPAIVAGRPSDSPLIQLVTSPDEDLRMPPEEAPLTKEQVTILTDWIESGAPWPDAANDAAESRHTDHWSFAPVQRPDVPETRRKNWSRTAVDAFVLAELERNRLAPAPSATATAWLRRVTFDLTGLPPTVEELEAFLADQEPGAMERVVDRLLQSPHYGERWAQHWLDVVRYADTHGFEVNTERPHAWPYRDYVIAAFNSGTPYDQFVREQLVGEQLNVDAATGFLVTASVLLPGQIGKDAASIRLARQDAIDEIVVNIGQTFLGLSIGCARCHHHKFDALSQRDYYAMQGFVAGVEYKDRVTDDADAAREAAALRRELQPVEQQLAQFVPLAASGQPRPAVNARQNIDRFPPVEAAAVRLTVLATNKLEPCIDELEIFTTDGENVALASAGTTSSASGSRTQADRHELRFVNDGLYGNSRSWMSSTDGGGWVTLTFSSPRRIARVVWGRDREGKFRDRLAVQYRIEAQSPAGDWFTLSDWTDRATFQEDSDSDGIDVARLDDRQRQEVQQLRTERDALADRLSSVASGQRLIFAGRFRTPDDIHLLRRGDPEQPVEPVAPAVPSALGSLTLPRDTDDASRRRVLADWITSRDNPLTARVMVNRIWQARFGTGVVSTPNDFGRNGVPPTHPDLLDWLAAEFMTNDWSVRHLDRMLVLSSTYRQSSQHRPDAAAVDNDVRLLWRYPTRRLDGESIRDGVLSISGQLNRTGGGPGFDLFDKRGGLTGFQPVEHFTGRGLRRMIYAHRVRRERDAVFGAFDCPDAGQSTPRRRESTTAIQALNLFNSRFMIEQSRAFADRVTAAAGDSADAQVILAYRLALTREPDSHELHAARSVLQRHGLATVCRALFNSNEFLFLP